MILGSRRIARWSTGSCRCGTGSCGVALYRQLLKCCKGIGAVRGSIDAEHHALLTVPSLTAISPYRISIIDLDLEMG